MSLQQTFYGVAQPIVNQTNAGVSSLSGSISGNSSSGAGPNPSVSTLTFAPFAQGTTGFMNMNSFFAIFDSGSGTPAGNNYTLGIQAQTNPNTAGNPFSFMSSFVSTSALTNFSPGYDVSPATASLITGASSDGRAIIANATPLSTLTLLANPVNIPYDLQVSSINGQAPGGGGGGPAIGTSSITTSTITCPDNSSSGLSFVGPSVPSPVGIALTPLTGQYGNTGVVGAWGKEVYQGNPGYGEFAVQRLYLVDATGGATNQTKIQNYGNQISIETTSSISLQADTYVTGGFNTSTINVSSINGGVPALTSLFATLFQANPSLSTIVY